MGMWVLELLGHYLGRICLWNPWYRNQWPWEPSWNPWSRVREQTQPCVSFVICWRNLRHSAFIIWRDYVRTYVRNYIWRGICGRGWRTLLLIWGSYFKFLNYQLPFLFFYFVLDMPYIYIRTYMYLYMDTYIISSKIYYATIKSDFWGNTGSEQYCLLLRSNHR